MIPFLILCILPTFILGFWAQSRVKGAYNKWSQVGSRGRITGREAAEAVMHEAGIYDVDIVEIPGQLTDHYNPGKKQLALSKANYRGTSLAALGVAAHEAGHAIQHAQGYAPLKARMSLVGVTSFASGTLNIVMMIAFVTMFSVSFSLGQGLLALIVACYAILTVFQLITLPVEFDASNRAKARLSGLGIISGDEQQGVKETLDAAGWTYVAAFVISLGQLLYWVLMLLGNRE